MNSLLPTCFLPLAVILSLHTGTLLNLKKPDTLTIHSTGIYNSVVIDSVRLNESLNESVVSAVKGEIIQTGKNNRVEIKTGGEEPKNKHQKTINKSQINSKIPTTKTKQSTKSKPATCNLKHATFTIKQTGKNNRVKINSR
jgi:hypothetical protein